MSSLQSPSDFTSRLKPTGYWRNIVERSIMTNNDEWVRYSSTEQIYDRNSPSRLVLSRPVFEVELQAGLNPKTKPYAIDAGFLSEDKDKAPPVTHMLDAFIRLRKEIQQYLTLSQMGRNAKPDDAGRALAAAIASSYYDCMSGGWSSYSIWAARMLSRNLDRSIQVYPKGEEAWHTIGDFLNATAGNDAAIEPHLQMLMKVPTSAISLPSTPRLVDSAQRAKNCI
jgi:hypothetical protein